MSFAPTLEPIKIRFPRTDVLNLNAAAEMIEARSIQGAKIRIADDGYRKRWLRVILKGLCEARIFAPETTGELADFPEGYQLVQTARRTLLQTSKSRWDTYLIGSPNVKGRTGFRSARDFIPHAIWLFCNPGLNHALCTHRRARLNPGDHQHLQNITNLQSQGLPFSSLDSRSSSISIDEAVHQLRETRSDSEIRKGEVIWAALNPAITDFDSRAAPNAIRLWPALVLELTTFRSENTTIFKVQLFGLLPSQACSVQKSRILPFNAYTLPLVLTNRLRFVLQSRQAQAYPDSPELLTLNFEESDRAFPHNPSFAAAALTYIQALSEAFRHIHGRSCYRNVVLHLEMATATPNISFIPCNQCMSGFQDNAESSAFQWGAEYIQAGDLVRLKTSRKDLVPFQQFLHPPSGPVQSYSQIWSPPNENGGAFSRGLFLKIMTVQLLTPAEHPESPSTTSAVGILYEVADEDASVLGRRLAADEAHHEFKFCSIMKSGYLAVVALNDIRGRYYPAPQVISTFYNLKLESRESLTPSPSQHHLQMLAGLWPDDNFDARIEFGDQQILARAGNKEEFADILNHCAAIARQKHLSFEKCIHPKTEESD